MYRESLSTNKFFNCHFIKNYCCFIKIMINFRKNNSIIVKLIFEVKKNNLIKLINLL